MTATAAPSERLAYLDMTKGILVLLMVIYHSLNYTADYHLAFRYLSFLPLSFIIITGFLLSSVYSGRYAAGDRTITGRLLLRGARLLALFTVLNVAAQFVRSPAYGKSVGLTHFLRNWDDVYLAGGSRVAAFEVLLPISYLLILAPWLIALSHRYASFLWIASAALLTTGGLLDSRGIVYANLNFLSVGILGMLTGRLWPRPFALGQYFWAALVAYGLYFPLGVARGWVFLIQLLGAILALALICAACLRLSSWRQWSGLVRMGQYSLLSYIAQIAVLQLLSRFLGRPHPLSVDALVLFAGTLALTIFVVELTDFLRKRSNRVDTLYRAIFA